MDSYGDGRERSVGFGLAGVFVLVVEIVAVFFVLLSIVVQRRLSAGARSDPDGTLLGTVRIGTAEVAPLWLEGHGC